MWHQTIFLDILIELVYSKQIPLNWEITKSHKFFGNNREMSAIALFWNIFFQFPSLACSPEISWWAPIQVLIRSGRASFSKSSKVNFSAPNPKMDQIAVLYKSVKDHSGEKKGKFISIPGDDKCRNQIQSMNYNQDFCVIRFEIFPFKVMDVEVYIECQASTVESHHWFCTDETSDGFPIIYPKAEHLSYQKACSASAKSSHMQGHMS